MKRNRGSFQDPAGADAKYRVFVINVGVSAQTVYRRADIQESITEDVDASREAGASGYVTKDRIASELVAAIVEVTRRRLP